MVVKQIFQEARCFLTSEMDVCYLQLHPPGSSILRSPGAPPFWGDPVLGDTPLGVVTLWNEEGGTFCSLSRNRERILRERVWDIQNVDFFLKSMTDFQGKQMAHSKWVFEENLGKRLFTKVWAGSWASNSWFLGLKGRNT